MSKWIINLHCKIKYLKIVLKYIKKSHKNYNIINNAGNFFLKLKYYLEFKQYLKIKKKYHILR